MRKWWINKWSHPNVLCNFKLTIQNSYQVLIENVYYSQIAYIATLNVVIGDPRLIMTTKLMLFMSRWLSIQLRPGSSPMTMLGEEKPRLKMFCFLLSSSKKLLYFMTALSFMILGSSIIQFRKEIFSKILNSVRLNSINDFIIIKDILFSN